MSTSRTSRNATSASKTTRAQARVELTGTILHTARRHLAEAGAAGLSLRAIARELGMVSSAMYRYFASRDELLTALIIDAYNSVGDRAETTESEALDEGASSTERWVAVHLAVRDWALSHRHEFAMLYGTPVPGYFAPETTTVAAARLPLTLAKIVAGAEPATPPGVPVPGTGLVAPQVRELLEPLPRTNPTAMARVIMAWSGLLGLISAELFGHYTGVVTDNRAFFEHAARTTAAELGLPA